MKRILKILSIFFLIILIYNGIKNKNTTNSLREDKSDFAISDTLMIEKIILENRSLEKIKLTRDNENKKWILNDSLLANQHSINLILKTIKEMRVKQPISRSAVQNIIKRMAIQNTKVELFNIQKKIKTIYIGGETADQLGTYMMISGAKEPYIVHIPGFNGYLSSRFLCKKEAWRSKKIFTEKIIKASHQIYNNQEIEIDKQNFIFLDSIYCEQYIDKILNIQEIKQRKPFLTFKTLSEDSTEQIRYCIRKKPVNKEKYANDKFDKERFYLLHNETLTLIQYSQFKELIKSENIMKDFLP